MPRPFSLIRQKISRRPIGIFTGQLIWMRRCDFHLILPLKPKQINGIGPGPTLENTEQDDGEFAAEAKATLLGEGSPPDTILHGVRYLLSAKAVTGQMIAVDGGQHLVWQTPDLEFGFGGA